MKCIHNRAQNLRKIQAVHGVPCQWCEYTPPQQFYGRSTPPGVVRSRRHSHNTMKEHEHIGTHAHRHTPHLPSPTSERVTMLLSQLPADVFASLLQTIQVNNLNGLCARRGEFPLDWVLHSCFVHPWLRRVRQPSCLVLFFGFVSLLSRTFPGPPALR